MVVRTGNGGRSLGERDQSGDVASGVGGDRTDRERRDDLAVVATARPEGLGSCVDVGVDAAVGEVEALAYHCVQQARLGASGRPHFSTWHHGCTVSIGSAEIVRLIISSAIFASASRSRWATAMAPARARSPSTMS